MSWIKAAEAAWRQYPSVDLERHAMRSLLHVGRETVLIAAIAVAPVGCARNDVPTTLEPGQEASAAQRSSEGPPAVALVGIGAALMLLLVVLAIEEGGAGLVTPPPPGS